jgi:hypothetical protein
MERGTAKVVLEKVATFIFSSWFAKRRAAKAFEFALAN